MQRKATKNTRAANAEEKAFQAWIKEQDCCGCGRSGPSIGDHCEGSTFKNNKVLVGHWFVIPLCVICDKVKTFGNHRDQFKVLGFKNSAKWCEIVDGSPFNPPVEVYEAIKSWRR